MASKTNQEYAERLQKMIQLETVSDPKCGSPQENFEAFHDLLCKLFPNLYKVCTVQDFHGSLLLRWRMRALPDGGQLSQESRRRQMILA